MKFNKIIAVSAIATAALISCDADETLSNENLEGNSENELFLRRVDLTRPSSLNIVQAKIEALTLLKSIKADGGEPYDYLNPAVEYTDAQRVFVPSSLGIEQVHLFDYQCIKVLKKQIQEKEMLTML